MCSTCAWLIVVELSPGPECREVRLRHSSTMWLYRQCWILHLVIQAMELKEMERKSPYAPILTSVEVAIVEFA